MSGHKHPVVEKILEHRGLKKLLGTYIDALPLLINPRTGRVHTLSLIHICTIKTCHQQNKNRTHHLTIPLPYVRYDTIEPVSYTHLDVYKRQI